MSAQEDCWARGVRRAAFILGLLATHECTIVLADPSTRALLREIWRETIHEMYLADPEYHCAQWCWMRLSEAQQLERFTGSLGFDAFIHIIANVMHAATERART